LKNKILPVLNGPLQIMKVAELRDCIATALWQHLSEKPLNNHRKYEELFE